MRRDDRRVMRGAAGDKVDLPPLRGVLLSPAKLLAEIDALARHAPQQRMRHDLGLLVDLLEHEVRVSAAVRHRRVPIEVHRLLRVFHSIEVKKLAALFRYLRHLVVIHKPDVARILQQRRGVGGAEALVLRVAHDQRRALAGHPDLVRLVIEHDDEREGAADALRQLYDRRLRVSVVDIAEVLHGGFRIRLRVELYPVRLQVGAYLARVLDDAVMHQHHAVIA